MVEFRWFPPGIDKEMERFLDRVSGIKPPPVRYAPQLWVPAMDVYETESEVVVWVELAGVSEDDFEVVADGTTFVVRGERPHVLSEQPCRNYHRMEIFCGPFQRGIVLPTQVDPSRARASFENGLLEVALPKVGEALTLRVRIKTSRGG